jgi:hypothetical protein
VARCWFTQAVPTSRRAAIAVAYRNVLLTRNRPRSACCWRAGSHPRYQ